MSTAAITCPKADGTCPKADGTCPKADGRVPRLMAGSAPTGRRRVVLVHPMPHPSGEAMLRDEAEVIEGWRLGPEARAAAVASAHALGGEGRTADITAGPKLEVIASYGSGTDNIDVRAATEAGIAVVNAAGSQYRAVAEHGVGLMLAFARRIAYADRVMHTKRRFIGRPAFAGEGWPGWPTQLEGKTLGIVGFGFIGRDLAAKCRLAFDMEVLVYSPRFDPVEGARQNVEVVDELDDLLRRSDYVSLCVPLTPETAGMIGPNQLAGMKAGSVLVNLSRGGTVDTEALLDALRRGHLAGAALDVFDPEPLPDGHPLYQLDNVVLTPHIGGWARETLPVLAQTAAREILRVWRGQRPWRLVNPEVWTKRRGSPA
jgi:D-3-phosphoglycerate dehydrogenase / 2-oxoglutarate reductase